LVKTELATIVGYQCIQETFPCWRLMNSACPC